jgi:tripartite-type tricarboxylate transporter receptor subunit TctC
VKRRGLYWLLIGIFMLSLVFSFGCDTASKEAVEPGQNEELAFPEPGKTLTLVCPYAPGGLVDTALRAMQPFFENELGIRAEVLNLDGAAGLIAYNEAYRRPADGYTIIYTGSPFGPHIFPHMAPDSTPWEFDDFRCLGFHSDIPTIGVITLPEAPWDNFEDFILDARERPGEITLASLGPGRLDDLMIAELQDFFDVEFNHVFYDSGSTMMTDLYTGDLDVVVRSALQLIEDTDVKILTFFGKEYPDYFPDQEMPIIADFQDDLNFNIGDLLLLASSDVNGLAVRSDVPDEIFNRLSKAFENIATDAEFIESVSEFMYPTWIPADEANEIFRNYYNDIGTLLEK